jgi:hypothetical protein
VGLFDQIPDEFLEKARNIPLVYSDRSVGANIDTALDCLAASSDWGSIPGHCRRDYTGKDGSTWVWKAFSRNEYLNGQVPERIRFDPDPVKYDRSKWEFDFRGGDWEKMIAEFIQIVVPAHIDSKQSLSFQFNYFSVGPGSDIADDALGFFVDQPHDGYYGGRERWDISDMQALEAQYPDKIIIYWTTSLARAVGTPESQKFNEQMRAYALAHGKVLLDVADIISHDADGNVCYDNRDGVEYCGENGCENYPDDGLDIPAICQDYTTELDGGHLGSVSAGKIMVAKAFWVLMARIAGWDGK